VNAILNTTLQMQPEGARMDFLFKNGGGWMDLFWG
jgi:hypothetical protein